MLDRCGQVRLSVECQYRGMYWRAGIYEALEDRLKSAQFGTQEEALTTRRDEERRRNDAMEDPRELHVIQPTFFSMEEEVEDAEV